MTPSIYVDGSEAGYGLCNVFHYIYDYLKIICSKTDPRFRVAEEKDPLFIPFCGILVFCHPGPLANSVIRCLQPRRLACLSSKQACALSKTSSPGWVPRRCRQVLPGSDFSSQASSGTRRRTGSHPILRRQCMSSIQYQRCCNVSDAWTAGLNSTYREIGHANWLSNPPIATDSDEKAIPFALCSKLSTSTG